jgi:hypothetical protein
MIYIISINPNINIGHNWIVDKYIRRAFRQFQIRYTYINQDADVAMLEDGVIQNSNSQYLKITHLKNAIDHVRRLSENDPDKNRTIFLTWIPQFSSSELAEIFRLAEAISANIVGISLPTNDALFVLNQSTRYVHEEFFQIDSKHKLLVADDADHLVGTPSLIQLPEYAEVSYFLNEEKKYDLSFFGQLSAYRGLADIFLIALFNPKLKIRIKGFGFSARRSFRPYRYKYLRYKNWKYNPLLATIFSLVSLAIASLRYLPNVTFSKRPFPSEVELDQAMRQTKAIYYGAKYPHGSGIVSKSQSAGIPVLWNGWEGRAFNSLTKNSPEGFLTMRDIVIPNRVTRKLQQVVAHPPIQEELWQEFSVKLAMVFKV